MPILGSYLTSPLLMYMYNVFLDLKALYIKNVIYLIILPSHLIFLIICCGKYEMYYIIFYGFAINLFKDRAGFYVVSLPPIIIYI